MRINNNIMAMNAHRQLSINQSNASKSMERLSSGMRINRAGDDAAGLAISEKMRGQIRGLKQAQRNAQDGISLIQTAEGALNETHAILQRMRELAVQAASDTNIGVDRSEIQKEMNELIDELDRIANQTQFNEQNLLDGTFTDKKFHIGANASQDITLSIASMKSGAAAGGGTGTPATSFNGETREVGGSNITLTGTYNGINDGKLYLQSVADGGNYKYQYSTDGSTWQDLSTGDEVLGITLTFSDAPEAVTDDPVVIDLTAAVAGGGGGTGDGLGVGSLKVDNPTKDSTGGIMDNSSASAAITTIQEAIEKVSAERSKLGAYQNRLEHTIANLGTSAENLQAAESRIRDLDMAEEIMAFTKNNILQQAATAMLAQANMAPQSVLQLLG
jgi:flagellin